MERPPNVQLFDPEVGSVTAPVEPEAPGWRRPTRGVALGGAALTTIGVVAVLVGIPFRRDEDGLNNGHFQTSFQLMTVGGAIGLLGAVTSFGAWIAQNRREVADGTQPAPPTRRRLRLIGTGYTLSALALLALVLGPALSPQPEGGGNLGAIVGGSLGAFLVSAGVSILVAGYTMRAQTRPTISVRAGAGNASLHIRF